MQDEVQREGCLYQDVAVGEIIDRYGEEFAYYNDDGNPAIDGRVLTELRRRTNDLIVWSQSERLWRLRETEDEPGRKQP